MMIGRRFLIGLFVTLMTGNGIVVFLSIRVVQLSEGRLWPYYIVASLCSLVVFIWVVLLYCAIRRKGLL